MNAVANLTAESMLAQAFARVQREVDSAFDAFLPVPNDSRARLVEAMRHAAIGGGKREIGRAHV